MREAIRVRYDLPTFSTTTWLTTSAVNAMINSSVQALSAILMESYGDNYYTTSASLTTTANTGTTSLPTRCYKVLQFWWVRGTDDIVKVERGNADDLRYANYAARSWDQMRPRYRLQGTSTVQWLPIPSQAYTVACDYVQLPAELSADGDTFEAGPSWEEFVVADVCRKIAAREEKDISQWMAERGDAEARIRSQAPERDEGEALAVRDTWNPYGLSDYDLRNRITIEGR
jgi:hypothetical protein